MAPGMLPSPPITVTTKPFTVSGRVISGDSTPMAAPAMAPAVPPKKPAMMKVLALVAFTPIPHS